VVERGGKVGTFHVDKADKETVAELVRENFAREVALVADESSLNTGIGAEFDFRYNNRSKLGIDDEERADRALAGMKE
jgi:hypothetical protein